MMTSITGWVLDEAEGDRICAVLRRQARALSSPITASSSSAESVAHAFQRSLSPRARSASCNASPCQTGRPLRRMSAEAIATTTQQIDAELENAGLQFQTRLKRLLDPRRLELRGIDGGLTRARNGWSGRASLQAIAQKRPQPSLARRLRTLRATTRVREIAAFDDGGGDRAPIRRSSSISSPSSRAMRRPRSTWRGAVFRDDGILLVPRGAATGAGALPGGWADNQPVGLACP